MKEIPLTQGKVAIVDDEDYEKLNQYKWYARKHRSTFYAVRKLPRVNGKRSAIMMHRQILELKPGDPDVDHRDGNGLNNRRSNLRTATNSQNMMNQKKQKGRTSQFKGVSWHKNRKMWRAEIKLNSKRVHLGYFAVEEEAARAYDQKAKELFGEYARANGL